MRGGKREERKARARSGGHHPALLLSLSRPNSPRRLKTKTKKLTCAMSMAFSNTPQWSQLNSISPYTAFQAGSASSGTDGIGGRSAGGRSAEP